MSLYILFLLLMTAYIIVSYPGTNAAKILIPATVNPGRGHTSQLCALSAELTLRNHHVTILVPSDDQRKIREKFADSNATVMIEYNVRPVELSDNFKATIAGNVSDIGILGIINYAKEVINDQVLCCQELLRNTYVMKILKEEKYDLIIADMHNGCDVLLPEALDVPFVALTSNMNRLYMNEFIYGFPIELSYCISRNIERKLENDTTFWIRTKNVVIHYFFPFLALFPSWTSPFSRLQKEFNITPETSIFRLANKAQFWMSQYSFQFGTPIPSMPNWRPVGGMAAARPGQLPKVSINFRTRINKKQVNK